MEPQVAGVADTPGAGAGVENEKAPREAGAATEAVDVLAPPYSLGGSNVDVLEGLRVKRLVKLLSESGVAWDAQSVEFSSVLTDIADLLSKEKMPGWNV